MAKNTRRARRPMARHADRYELYGKAVQAPAEDVRFLRRVYESTFGVRPRLLREDFCGTAQVCRAWVELGSDFRAYGVDLDPEPLEWARRNTFAGLREAALERIQLVRGDVRDASTPMADVVAAENFSYLVFQQRDALRAYFSAARSHLAKQGVLVCDLMGGYEVLEDGREDVTDCDGFKYVWEQASYDPINAHGVYHIHFRFPDRSEMSRAFSYEWRLWTIPEVREVMLEAGFDRADVYWEDTDRETGDGSGVYRRRNRGEADPAWIAYVVGVKLG